jgi:hypothetical protein
MYIKCYKTRFDYALDCLVFIRSAFRLFLSLCLFILALLFLIKLLMG